MPVHIDLNDPKYRNAAAEILRRHDNGEPEANITSVVRDFLIVTGLARSEEMVEENPPSDASRRAVDLTALDTFIEFKRRIGTASGGTPNPQYVEQLDDYLAQSAKQGKVRMGVLTDGKRWLLRWPGAGEARLTRPYAFTLEEPDNWIGLYEWLRDSALVSLDGMSPDRKGIEGHFGPGSPSYQRDIAALKSLYLENAELETVRVKRRLWYDLLRTALGEVAYTPEGLSEESQARLAAVGVGTEEMDDLFVRPHLLERRHRHGGAGVIRHRHSPPGRYSACRPASRPRAVSRYGVAGRLGVGLLRLAQRGRRKAAAANAGPPSGPFRLGRGPTGHRRNPVRDGDTA